MKKTKILSIVLIAILNIIMAVPVFADTNEGVLSVLTQSEIDKIDEVIKQNMTDGKIPGVSLIIVRGNEVVYKNGYGYSDLENKTNVTPDTYFELGSNSKAFTGLAILKLEKEGLVNLNDPIEKYIPWFEMTYNGEKALITVEQVMNHTSGIPFKSIDKIEESNSDKALEDAVHTLVGTELQSEPGEAFSYATINYDILGFIIEMVTHQSYETYVTENVLNPVGLNNTYMFKEDIASGEMSKGYKVGFLQALEYNAPTFRGNKPAGYILSNGNDIGKWLQTQLGVNEESTFDQELITNSHTYDEPLFNNGESYVSGWFVNKSTNEVYHSGSNPNFSSHIVLNTGDGSAVAVLANLNSSFTSEMAFAVMDVIQDNEITTQASDMYLEFDKIAIVAIIVSILIILLMIFFIARLAIQLHSAKRSYVPLTSKGLIGICVSLVFLGILGFIAFKLPEIFLDGVTWKSLRIWAPQTVIYAAVAIGIAVILIYLFLIADTIFKHKDNKPYFMVVFISLISGFGNSLIIFMINTALAGEIGFNMNLFLFFILGIVAYAGGQKIVRAKLIKLTNHIVYKLRVELFNKILNTSFENIEKLDDGIIQATLNNDTEIVSGFANMIVTVITNIFTLACCFIYLGFVNLFALLISILTIVLIASIYFVVTQSANRLWEETRTTQNVFFRFINDMNRGFKELRLNIKRRKAFEEDVTQLSYDYSIKRGKAFLSFANVFILGELVFTLAIGFIVFFFPAIFKDLQMGDLRSYVFILLYMTGPVNGILNTIPNLLQIKVSWGRINKLLKDVSALSEQTVYTEEKQEMKHMKLELKNIEYEYNLENAEKFRVGPISYNFNSGEIIFIIGGNGSGKSTLAKLITGLYRPQKGEIKLNNKNLPTENLEQKYSAIFGDSHLFDKLYGIDYENKKEEFQKYLNIMQLNEKIEMKDGRFNTTKLSTGQRKRLALAISYLEDRPMYLFDEWAADQDPEFREFFYRELLPELKQKGKCVIVITHDDRYFNIADKLIKMEFGKMVSESYEQIAATTEN